MRERPLAINARISAVTQCGHSACSAGGVPAPKSVHLRDVERFSQKFEEGKKDTCELAEDAPDYKIRGDQHDSAENGSAALLLSLLATSLDSAVLNAVERLGSAKQPSRSAELAELAQAIIEHILVGQDEVGDSVVHIVLRGEVFGNTHVTISCRPNALRVYIRSERLRHLLKSHGHAFACDLSNQLGVHVAVAVCGNSPIFEEQGGNCRSRGWEPVLHFVAEKST
ncbi:MULTISPECIES: hypothetical protein [unclassified Sinorhizobium]|uniref:hypothetical protein n=1 Tax=unclassified Sinorhizobium TaxID=2613772 RepID=UPI0024C313AF|nr:MULTISPECIES: hypothetical protein [unclassified Sinorhizobium]MDK1378211.1 hypothetical protein [Sinorhizobium sp. 6-70]MDK1482058.1 hypothetical protein [Sinorhizobium sp. 6-117]